MSTLPHIHSFIPSAPTCTKEEQELAMATVKKFLEELVVLLEMQWMDVVAGGAN